MDCGPFLKLHVGFILLLLPLSAEAEARRLTTAEIAGTLVGNTVVGTFNGKPFRQYFRNDGTTVFQRQGEGRDIGKWRTTDDDEYCAWWNRGGWSCYWVSRDGDTIVWHYKDKVAYPATLLPGDRMDN
jgi:hypothetical protein